MSKVLRQFPLYLVFSAIAGIPLLLAVGLAIELITDFRTQAQNSLRDREIITAVTHYDELAHNMAVERGLTAGVLGSKGDPEQVQKLLKQRAVVDSTIRKLKEFTPVYLNAAVIADLQQDIDTELDKLNAIRTGVDRLNPTSSPFIYYSNLNQLSIDNIVILLSKLRNHSLGTMASSLNAVVIMKERAGQVRGALNGIFSRRSATPAEYTGIQNYIRAGEYAQRTAIMELPEPYRQQLQALSTNPTWREVEKIQNEFLRQRDNLTAINGPQPSTWFASATQRIQLINGVRKTLQDAIVIESEQRAHSSYQAQNILVGVTLFVTVLLSWLVITAVKGLRHRASALTNALKTMAANKNLSLTLDTSGNDEISSIARSINQLTLSTRTLLKDITAANSHSHTRLDKIVTTTGELSTGSVNTNARCTNIATAMTQLSHSSTEIAESANRALQETQIMNNQVVNCQNDSDTSYREVEALIQQIDETLSYIQALEEDTQSIEQIVSTINGVSEQTNLLALNAAIEAARAGEHGRGFAVVSTEVRNLAQRSQEATENISRILDRINQNTRLSSENILKSKSASDKTYESVQLVKTSISTLGDVITHVDQHINNIAHATIEQSKACEDINQDVDMLTDIAQGTGQHATSLNAIVEQYRTEVDDIHEQMQQFQLQ